MEEGGRGGGARERKGGVHVEGCVWLALRYHIIDGEIFGFFHFDLSGPGFRCRFFFCHIFFMKKSK
jgi:hypothetical protein